MNIFKHLKKQSGSVILLTACGLSLLMLSAGLAIDMGNLYSHYSDLQNVADSAAKAGAYGFTGNDTDTVEDFPIAKRYANYDADENIQHTNATEVTREYKMRELNSKKYFRAKLDEDVPLYFMKIFYGDTARISASAIACISYNGAVHSHDIFDKLFTYKNSLTIVQNLPNPDTNAYDTADYINNGNASIFDGDISATTKIGIDNTTYDDGNKYCLLNSDSLNYKTAKEAVAAGAISKEYLDDQADMYSFEYSDTLKKYQTEQYQITQDSQRSFDSDYLNTYHPDAIYYTNNNDGNIVIDKPIPASTSNPNDDPLYVIVTNSSTAKLNVSCTMTENNRPIIICVLTPANQWGKPAYWVTGNSSALFRGLIYAPHAYVGLNENGMSFYGNIIADEIYSGQHARYKQINYFDNGSSGSSSASIGGKTSISLIDGEDSINWDDED